MSGERLVYDIETDGLLEDVTRIHHISMSDPDTGVVSSYGPGRIEAALTRLKRAALRIAHNGINYDEQVIRKLYPHVQLDPAKLVDTLLLSKLVFPNIADRDFDLHRKKKLPGNLIGSHSLKAWGLRLGFPKDDYAEKMEAQGIDPWAQWSQEMADYCDQDVRVTMALFSVVERRGVDDRAKLMEHELAWILQEVEEQGWPFDYEAAEQLYFEICAEREKVRQELTDLFPARYIDKGLFIPKRSNRNVGYELGAHLHKVELLVFNPGSRKQVADNLTLKYGWEPEEFTETGEPKINDEILEALPYPEAKELARYFMLTKRAGQIGEGENAWLKMARKDKQGQWRIHGRIDQLGTVSGRASHSTPNTAQVPANDKPYGERCRALFGPGKGRVQLGADASGLELRTLAHFLKPRDGGAYIKLVAEGDVHTANQQAAGLPTRNNAKTFISMG